MGPHLQANEVNKSQSINFMVNGSKSKDNQASLEAA